MWMFKNPQDYSVLVAENMFGDIVSDLCAGLVGGLGFAPSANLGDKYAVFEPTHGISAEIRRPIQGQPDRDASDREADARLAEGNRNGEASGKLPSPASSPKAKCAPTTWAAKIPRSTSPKPSLITRVHNQPGAVGGLSQTPVSCSDRAEFDRS